PAKNRTSYSSLFIDGLKELSSLVTSLDDVLVLILVSSLVICFIAVMGILARKFGTLRKTLTEMERVSSATESTLAPLVNTVNEMRTEVKSVSPSVQLLG